MDDVRKTTQTMKYLSLFTGIGGFELGIMQAYERLYNDSDSSRKPQAKGKLPTTRKGAVRTNREMPSDSGEPSPLVCVGFSEIDKYATQVYQQHFPNHKNYGDITQIKAEDLPDFDFLCGGFPCQSFSIAGKRGGFNDTRGTLFFDIARILKAKRPRLFLLENVKGLLSHDEGRTFTTIISTLDELGYDLQWEVLNSKNFGVPQNRERVFIVGHLRGTSRPKVFPIDQDGTADFGGVSIIDGYNRKPSREIGAVRQNMGNGGSLIAKTVRRGGRASPHGSKQNWDSYEYEGKIRRLTPKECERLQGFPDDWTTDISDSQRYKCCGNAVTVNVIQAIMEKLR